MAPPAPNRATERAGARVLIYSDAASTVPEAADRIVSAIGRAVAARGRAVLGLATGATPIPVYAELVRRHRDQGLSFAAVSTYNLDEYYPIGPFDPNSYRTYMDSHLFRHVDLAPHRAHVFDGTVPEHAANEHAADFDRWIAAESGLDFQLLGLGRNGHIGFNEPSDRTVEDARALPSRVAELHPVTLADAARDFGGLLDAVPRRALTLGTKTVLAAREILVLAFGPNKAQAVARSLDGPETAEVPGSLLRDAAGRVTWLLDEAAARELT